MKAKKITKQNLMDLSKEELVALTMNLSAIVQSQNEDIANLQELYRLKTARGNCIMAIPPYDYARSAA